MSTPATAEAGVAGFAHELNNRANNSKLNNAMIDVRFGTITPAQYAKTVLDVEKKGIAYQIKVVSELLDPDAKREDIKDEYGIGEFELDQAIKLRNKEISQKDLLKNVEKEINNVVIEATGENAIEKYKKDGAAYREVGKVGEANAESRGMNGKAWAKKAKARAKKNAKINFEK